jgi:hypothetical protein
MSPALKKIKQPRLHPIVALTYSVMLVTSAKIKDTQIVQNAKRRKMSAYANRCMEITSWKRLFWCAQA